MTSDDADGGPLDSVMDKVKSALGGGHNTEQSSPDPDLAAQARGEGSTAGDTQPNIGMLNSEGDPTIDSSRVDRAVAGGARIGDDQDAKLGPGGGASLDSGADDTGSSAGADLSADYPPPQTSGMSTEPGLDAGDAGVTGEAPIEDLTLERHSGI